MTRPCGGASHARMMGGGRRAPVAGVGGARSAVPRRSASPVLCPFGLGAVGAARGAAERRRAARRRCWCWRGVSGRSSFFLPLLFFLPAFLSASPGPQARRTTVESGFGGTGRKTQLFHLAEWNKEFVITFDEHLCSCESCHKLVVIAVAPQSPPAPRVRCEKTACRALRPSCQTCALKVAL